MPKTDFERTVTLAGYFPVDRGGIISLAPLQIAAGQEVSLLAGIRPEKS
jgi:hypothetical protein